MPASAKSDEAEASWGDTAPDVKMLLEHFENTSHCQRMKRMAKIGFLSRSDPSFSSLITKLWQGSLYEQMLAVQSTYGSEDVPLALEALRSPSRLLRARSIDMIRRKGTKEQVLAALPLVPERLQNVIAGRLRKAKRREILDAFVDSLRTARDRKQQFKRLLPLATHEYVEAHLIEIIEIFKVSDWWRLSRFHPSIAHEQIRDLIESSSTRELRDGKQGKIAREVIRTLDNLDMALDLVKLWEKRRLLEPYFLGKLLKQRTKDVAQIVIDSKNEQRVSFSAVLEKLETVQLLRLYGLGRTTISTHQFHKLLPEQRAAIYPLVRKGWRDVHGVLKFAVIKALPTQQRIAEARRHIKLKVYEPTPSNRCPYIALLPWDEANELQSPFLHSPDADIRARVLTSQINGVRYQRNRLSDALQMVADRQFEQDPVQRPLLDSLAQLPPSCWKKEHVAALDQIIRNCLDRPDLSRATVSSMAPLLDRIMPLDYAVAGSLYATIFKERRQIPTKLFPIRHPLTQSARKSIVEEYIIPTILTLKDEGDERTILAIVHSLDSDLPEYPFIIDLMVEMLHTTKHTSVSTNILGILQEHMSRRDFGKLAIQCVESDLTYFFVGDIRWYIQRFQQQLLTPYLTDDVEFDGKFKAGFSRPLFDVVSGYSQWTPHQQDLFAQSWKKHIDNNDTPSVRRERGLEALAELAYIEPTILLSYNNDPRPLIQDAALHAISRLDAAQGVPILLEALDDDRVRTAIYVLRGSLKEMSKSQALQLLREAPMSKVTVAKEIVRLIGDLDCDAAFRALLEIGKTDLHEHVRNALFRGLWTYLEQPETWQVLEQAAQGSDVSAALQASLVPVDGLSRQASRSLTKLFALLISHPSALVRQASLNRLSAHAWQSTDNNQILIDALMKLLESHFHGELTSAARFLIKYYGTENPPLVADIFRKLLPHKKCLLQVFDVYLSLYQSDMRDTETTTRSVLDVLKKDRLTVNLWIRLILKMPLQDIQEQLQIIAPYLHADALVTTEGLLSTINGRYKSGLETLEHSLASSEDEKLRRLAFSVLMARSRLDHGWTEELRQRLEIYQQDTSTLVAEAAAYVFPPPRDDEEKEGKERTTPVKKA